MVGKHYQPFVLTIEFHCSFNIFGAAANRLHERRGYNANAQDYQWKGKVIQTLDIKLAFVQALRGDELTASNPHPV